MPFVSSPVRVVPEPAAWAASPDKNTNSNQTVPVGSDASEHELRQRDKLEALKAEAAALTEEEGASVLAVAEDAAAEDAGFEAVARAYCLSRRQVLAQACEVLGD